MSLLPNSKSISTVGMFDMNNYFRFENQPCPICGEKFKADDDIVVCPVCGTPHHRECYKKNGECGNYDKHQQGFRWNYQTPENPAEEQKKEPYLFEQNPADTGSAGMRQEPSAQFAINGANPLLLFPKDIDESVTTEEVGEFVQVGYIKYLQNFFYEKTGKRTFNWAAFFFAPYWFFYRKMYKLGGIFIAAVICISLLFSLPSASRNFSSDISDFAEKYNSSSSVLTDEEYDNLISEYRQVLTENKAGMALLAVQSIFMLVLHLVAGFKANKWYYNFAIKKIRKIKQETDDANLQKLRIFKEGGIGMAVTILVVMGYEALFMLINILFQ